MWLIELLCEPTRYDMFGAVYDPRCMALVTVLPLGVAYALIIVFGMVLALWALS